MKIAECGFVYMITCLITGKIYVGSAVDVDRRFYRYKSFDCKGQLKIYRSLLKYGIENHIFEIVWSGLLEEMYKYETLIGWGFNVLEKETGLNLQLPKWGDKYICVSEETIEKLSKANKGRVKSKKERENISIARIGIKLSQQTKDKLSFINRNRSPELQEKMIKSCYRKPIIQLDLEDNFIRDWISARESSNQLNINEDGITSCCRGERKKFKEFKWKLKN